MLPSRGSHPLRKVISFRISASAFSHMPATVDGLLRNKSQIPLSPQKRNPIRVPLFLLPSRGSHLLWLVKVLASSQNSSSHGDGHAESYHSLRKAHSSSLIVHSPSPRLRLEAYTLSNRGRSLRITDSQSAGWKPVPNISFTHCSQLIACVVLASSQR